MGNLLEQVKAAAALDEIYQRLKTQNQRNGAHILFVSGRFYLSAWRLPVYKGYQHTMARIVARYTQLCLG